MRSIMSLEDMGDLRIPWADQFFQATERELGQVDFIEVMQNVMFYATLLCQRQQGGHAEHVRLPLAWQWGGEEEIVNQVKERVPRLYGKVLDYALAVSIPELSPNLEDSLEQGMEPVTEAELRGMAAGFIHYVQERLQFLAAGQAAAGRAWYL